MTARQLHVKARAFITACGFNIIIVIISCCLVSIGFGHLGHFSNYIFPPDTVPSTHIGIL